MAFDAIVESSEPVLTPSLFGGSLVGNISIWPWPRIIPTENWLLGFFRQENDHVYMFEMTLVDHGRFEMYAVGDLGFYFDIDSIDVADFGPLYFISTYSVSGGIKTYARDPSLSNPTANRDVVGINFIVPIETPSFATCCNYNGQLIGGNIYSPSEENPNPWRDLGLNSVLWSGIGRMEFNPELDRTAGFRQVVGKAHYRNPPKIHKVLPLQEGIVVYTDGGNGVLIDHITENIFNYGLVPLKGLGIASSNHVAGDSYVHGFIDLNRDFWTLENSSFRVLNQDGGKLTKHGFREYILPLFEAPGPVIVSYLPTEDRRFYISNGQDCIVITKYGAFQCHQGISGIVNGPDNRIYGTFLDSGDLSGEVIFDTVDFGNRGVKSIESMIMGIDCPQGIKVTGTTEWRIKKSSDFKSGSFRPVGNGEVGVHIAGHEFRPKCRFSDYQGCELSYVKANVKFSDSRFRRGLTSTSGVTRSEAG